MSDTCIKAIASTHAFDIAIATMIVIARDGRICHWNKSAEHLFNKDKAVSLNDRLLINELFQKRASSLITDIIVSASGAPFIVSLRTYQAEARVHKRSITVRAMTEIGEGTHYLLTIDTCLPVLTPFRRLNTELKEANARSAGQQQRMKEIERKNKELELFSIATAHDLKAPLIQVQMLLNVFSEDYGKALEEDAKELIDKADTSVQNLQKMIEKLLSQARMESGKQNDEVTDLDQSVAIVIGSMDEILESISAQVNVSAHLGTVRGNDVKFQQVLNNIISNSIKYRMADRQLTITVEVDTCENKPVRLRIRDNGIGFDTADAKRLFEPFGRLGDTKVEGHGIGLSTCRRVCEQQGWMLAAYGTPGEGSEFQIIFNTQLPHDLTAILSMGSR